MRQPNVSFALDKVAVGRLEAIAEQRNLSMSALLRNMVYDLINNHATDKENGDVERACTK